MRLIDVADVERSDSRWTAGLSFETVGCALESEMAGLCLPPQVEKLGGGGYGGPNGYPVPPFAVVTRLKEAVMCRSLDPEKMVRDAVEVETDKALGRALWYGTGVSPIWLGADGATLVPAGSGVADALAEFYRKTVGVEPVIHLGLKTAEQIGGDFQSGFHPAFPDVPIVINPSYPPDGLAVTGPINAWVGPTETTQTHDVRLNRSFTEATALAAVAFDPCTAVVRGEELPAQLYVGLEKSFASVRIVGAEAASTVDWGDATAITNIAPDPNAVYVGADHTYDNPGAYTITVTTEFGTTTHDITVVA